MCMSRSGFAKRASTCEACSVRGVRARFLTGRLERGSADVGMASGIGSDIVVRRIESGACGRIAQRPDEVDSDVGCA